MSVSVVSLHYTPLLTYYQIHSVVLTFSNKSLQQSPYFFIGSSLLEQRFSNLIECKHCRHTFRFSLNFICESHKTRPIEWMYSTSSARHTQQWRKTAKWGERQSQSERERKIGKRREKNETMSIGHLTFGRHFERKFKLHTSSNVTHRRISHIKTLITSIL